MIGKKRCDKKGFAIQFNWLFVLIGGVVIIGFFFSIINNLSAGDDERVAQQSTQELNDLLKASLSARDTQKIVKFDKEINFFCEDISEYHIKGSSMRVRYDYNSIFSPANLKGREVIVKTLVFEAPFKTQPLVFVTNKDIEYVVVSDSSGATSPILTYLTSFFPHNATRKAIPGNVGSYNNNNFDHTVFILTDDSYLTRLVNFDNAKNKAYAVLIKPGGGTSLDYGNVTFYYHDSSGFVEDGTVPFVRLETLLGAVIGHNKTIYECNFNKILQRISLLSGLHSLRMINYTNLASSYCTDHYPLAKTYLDQINITASKRPFTTIDAHDLTVAMNDLRSLNNYILTKTECPLIY